MMVKFLVAGVLLVSGSAWAETRVAVIDSQKIFDQAEASVLESDMHAKFDAREQVVGATKQKLMAMQAEAEKNGATMSPAQKKAKQQEFETLAADYEAKARQLNDEENQARNASLSAFKSKLEGVVGAIAAQDHYDLVVDTPIFSTKEMNIDDKVLQALGAAKQ